MVYGVGYDSGGVHLKNRDNKHTKCYSIWKDMLRRCYSELYQSNHETYKGCVVCEEWKDYQRFGDWFVENYKVGYPLDKDILGGGKLYSPQTCRFIPKDLNLLLTNITQGKTRNYQLPVGVCYNEAHGTYTAYCNDGRGKTVNLGSSSCKTTASQLYKRYKESLIFKKANHYYESGCIDSLTRDTLIMYKVK